MYIPKKIPSKIQVSLLALTVVTVSGCSSSGSSSFQPSAESQLPPGQGIDDSENSQNFTYGTVNPPDGINIGEVFELDTTTIQGVKRTDSTSFANVPFLPRTNDNGIIVRNEPIAGSRSTITVLDPAENGNLRIRLQDPDSGVDTILSGAVAFRDGPSNRSDGLTTYLSLSSLRPSVSTLIPSGDLRYAAYGYWSVLDEGNNVTSDQDINIGFAAGGYPTQDGDMPTTGSASFLGAASGLSIASTGKIQDIIGSAEMNVDFARGALSGNMTNMKTGDNVDGAATPWNDIGFNGTLNGNTFTARARATPPPEASNLIDRVGFGSLNSETALLGRNAVGSVNGRFYGPQASEAAGTWSLQDSDGNTAVGGFGVKQ